jgi:hypothetical protein
LGSGLEVEEYASSADCSPIFEEKNVGSDEEKKNSGVPGQWD